MVSTAEARETPTLHGPVAKFRNDKDMVLQKEKYLKVVLSRLGWSRHPSSLTVEDVCKVGYQQLVTKASIMDKAVLIACCTLTCRHAPSTCCQKMWSGTSSTSPIAALQVIRACLQSASALHARQLVHRDFRYANVLWDSEGPFVIDLEMAATPPLKVRHLSSSFLGFENRCRAKLC